MPCSSWLFIRERESIWIERPYGFSLIVAGPSSARAHVVFPNEEALQAYQVEMAERLTQAGWFLWGFDQERRKRDRVEAPAASGIGLERQFGADRRDTGRDGMRLRSLEPKTAEDVPN